jgi:uncharacterized protein YjiS (DUF1127 family)
MRTTDTALDFTLAVTPAVSRLAGVTKGLMTVWRLLRNRRETASLLHLDDRQLADIGLSRHDVRSATTSAFFDDTSLHLTQLARMRASHYYRDIRR